MAETTDKARLAANRTDASLARILSGPSALTSGFLSGLPHPPGVDYSSALIQAGQRAASDPEQLKFIQALQAQEQKSQDQASAEHPILHGIGEGAGFLASGLAFPEVRGATWASRIAGRALTWGTLSGLLYSKRTADVPRNIAEGIVGMGAFAGLAEAARIPALTSLAKKTLGKIAEHAGKVTEIAWSKIDPMHTLAVRAARTLEDMIHVISGQAHADRITLAVNIRKLSTLLPSASLSRIHAAMDGEDIVLSPEEREAYERFIKPMADELGYEPGHTHRIPYKHPGRLAGAIRKVQGRSALEAGVNPTGIPLFSTRVPGEMRRDFYALEASDREGKPIGRFIARIGTDGEVSLQLGQESQSLGKVLDEAASPIGKSFKHNGVQYTVAHARVSEIERATGMRYLHDPAVTTGLDWLEHRSAQAMLQLLDAAKSTGFITAAVPGEVPKGWVALESPYFRGAVAHPAVARVLNGYLARGGKLPQALNVLNHLLLRALFSVGWWHVFNIKTYELTSGISSYAANVADKRIGELISDLYRSVEQVHGWDDPEKLDSNYLRLLRQGFPLSGRFLSGGILEGAIEQSLRNVEGDPTTRSVLSSIGIVPAFLAHGLGKVLASGERVWGYNDSAALRFIWARARAKGVSLEQAAAEVFRVFPQYRISRVGPIGNFLQSSGFFWFAPYHVDMLRIAWNQLKGVAHLDPESVSQALAIAYLTFYLYPKFDEAVQSGVSPEAHLERFGASKLPYIAVQIEQRKKPVIASLASVMTPNPVVSLLINQGAQYAHYRKRYGAYPPLSEQMATWAGDVFGDSFYPLQTFLKYQTRQDAFSDALWHAFLSQMGILQTPPARARRY